MRRKRKTFITVLGLIIFFLAGYIVGLFHMNRILLDNIRDEMVHQHYVPKKNLVVPVTHTEGQTVIESESKEI